MLWLAFRSTTWPTAKGIIVSSNVKKVDFSEDVNYVPVIKYEFKVRSYPVVCDNVTYESFTPLLSETEAFREASKYSVGDEVDVYYDPTNYSEAVLVPGVSINGVRVVDLVTI